MQQSAPQQQIPRAAAGVIASGSVNTGNRLPSSLGKRKETLRRAHCGRSQPSSPWVLCCIPSLAAHARLAGTSAPKGRKGRREAVPEAPRNTNQFLMHGRAPAEEPPVAEAGGVAAGSDRDEGSGADSGLEDVNAFGTMEGLMSRQLIEQGVQGPVAAAELAETLRSIAADTAQQRLREQQAEMEALRRENAVLRRRLVAVERELKRRKMLEKKTGGQ
eukprot:TRINITY_DN9515_c0_g1_i3.p1 TRINITY_DN9515_c0_g1~~TRINITY_DN9515_c0_g1_i3.p1  ORF type:complete len:218 (+),score=27.41 TRINITY_DN9515_c0_g1_i3:61-714(+)